MARYRQTILGALEDPRARRRAFREAACVVALVVVAAIVSGKLWFWVSLGVGLSCAIAIAILELRIAAASRSDSKLD